MDPLMLTIDCGTQSLRACLFDRAGTLRAVEKASFEPYFSQAAGWAEQNAEVYWGALCEAAHKLREKPRRAIRPGDRRGLRHAARHDRAAG